MTLLRFFMLLSLVIWVGGIILFSFVVAPTLFSVLPTRNLAGLVVNRSLSTLHWVGIGCGCVFLVTSLVGAYYPAGDAEITAPRNVLVFFMVVVTAISQLVVAPKMAALRAQMGEIDQVAMSDARRVAFNQLHRWSTGLESAVLVLGLVAIYFVARGWTVQALGARR